MIRASASFHSALGLPLHSRTTNALVMSDTKGTAVQYPLALDHWPGSTRLLVHDQSGQRLCTVPRDFLLTSAVDAVALLASIVRMCVLEDGRLVDEQLNGVANVAQLDGRRSVWVREGERLEQMHPHGEQPHPPSPP